MPRKSFRLSPVWKRTLKTVCFLQDQGRIANLFLPVMYYLSKRPGNDVKRNSITTGRNVGDVEIIGISMKRKSLETRRSPLNIKQIQLKVKRIKIEVKRIEIAVERKISAVERKNSAVERKISAVQRKISYVKSLRIYLNEI